MTIKVGLARISPIPTADVLQRRAPDHQAALYYRLRLLPGRETPVVVNHDMGREVGRIRQLDRADGWHVALVELDNAPEWITSRTGVSLSTKPLHVGSALGVEVVTEALVVELSLVSPSKRPAETMARMMTLHDAVPVPIVGTTPTVPPLSEETALAHFSARVDAGERHEDVLADVQRRLDQQAPRIRSGRLRRNCGTILAA